MNSPSNSPTPIDENTPSSAAAAASKDSMRVDEYYALTIQALDQLTTIFSFPKALAQKAIEECGPEDVQTCYNWILDKHPQQDHGGPIVPKTDCPHVHCVEPSILDNLSDIDVSESECQHYGALRRRVSRKRLRSEEVGPGAPCGAGRLKREEDYETNEPEAKPPECPRGENWLCLTCGALLCSRYANGHAKRHWEDTKSESAVDDREDVAIGKAGMSYESIASSSAGHCVAVSLGDLSVWCYECGAYLEHQSLEGVRMRLEEMKFGSSANLGDEEAVRRVGVDDCGETSSDVLRERELKAPSHGQDEPTKLDPEKAGISDDNLGSSEMKAAATADQVEETPKKVDKRKGQPTKLDPEKAGTTEFSFSLHNSEAECSNSQNDNMQSDSEEEESESDHQAALLASLLQSEHGDAIRAYLARHSSFDPGNMGQCVPMHMPAPPSFPDEMAEFLKSPLCKSVVVLAGAGMSVSSGIPDFRSAGVGLYDTLQPDLLTASEVERELIAEDPTLALDKGLFLQNPLPMLELKRDFILGTHECRWKATLAHRFVELLHTKLGKLTRLYTQNIDGLELQCAGLPKEKVVNVHGSMGRAACELCEAEVDFDEFCAKVRSSVKDITGEDVDAPSQSTPINCEACGRPTVKPTIVLFRGSMPKEFHDRTAEDLEDCDLLIIMGTSLTVSPANSLVYRIPPTCLRLVVNNQRVGRMLGIDYTENSVRDVFAHGHSDEMCLDLIDKLGWLDDVSAMISDLPESCASMVRERLAKKDG